MVMLASASIFVICSGVLCVRETDLAWRIYEWDCRLMSMTPPRLQNWRLRVKQVGSALVGLGMVGLMVSMGIA
ncbi:MAG: hypothetical protein OHK0046_00500 [Anaerolineae bacterium]